jgi:hypothetical protein
MGFLDKLFHKKEYPPLDPASPVAAQFERYKGTLEAFAARIHDKLEAVPGDRAVYVFIGRPPDAFGVAWFLPDGVEHNFKTLMKNKGLQQRQIQVISDQLRAAYSRAQEEPRYAVSLSGKQVLIHPSASLEREVADIIHRVAD